VHFIKFIRKKFIFIKFVIIEMFYGRSLKLRSLLTIKNYDADDVMSQ